MNRRTSTTRIVVISALMVSLFVTLAPTKAQDGLANNEVLIKNWTRYTISCKVEDSNKGIWSDNFTLDPQQEVVVKDVNRIAIENATPYIIELKNRYSIEWSQSEGFYVSLLKLR